MRIVTVSFFLAAVAAVFFLTWYARREKYLLVSAITYSALFAAYIILAVLRLRLTPSVAVPFGFVVTSAATVILLITLRSGKATLITAVCLLIALAVYFGIGPHNVKAQIDGVMCVGTYDDVTGIGETIVTYYKVKNPLFISADGYFRINYGVILGDFDPDATEPCRVDRLD